MYKKEVLVLSLEKSEWWIPNLRYRESSQFLFQPKVTVAAATERRRWPKDSACVLQPHTKALSGAVYIAHSQFHRLHLLGWNAPSPTTKPNYQRCRLFSVLMFITAFRICSCKWLSYWYWCCYRER